MKVLRESKITVHASLDKLSLMNFCNGVLVDKFGYTVDLTKGSPVFTKGKSEVILTSKELYIRNGLGTFHLLYNSSEELYLLEFANYLELSSTNAKSGFTMILEK